MEARATRLLLFAQNSCVYLETRAWNSYRTAEELCASARAVTITPLTLGRRRAAPDPDFGIVGVHVIHTHTRTQLPLGVCSGIASLLTLPSA
jgi:hypothetical protein